MATGIKLDGYRAGVESGKFPQPVNTGGDRPPGWFTDEQGKVYESEADRVGRMGIVVEVGCYMGRSMSWIAPICIANRAALYAVDPWEHCPRCEFERYMELYGWLDRIKIIQADSVDAATRFFDKSVALCFIDARHDYDNVKADIGAWLPKIESGGTLMGHDYADANYGTREAVDERFGDSVIIKANMWIARP